MASDFFSIACSDTFTPMTDKHGYGGVRKDGISMNDDCRKACLAQDFDDCGAYDFDTIMGRCWLYKTAPQSTSLNAASGLNHYVRVRCTGIIFLATFMVK